MSYKALKAAYDSINLHEYTWINDTIKCSTYGDTFKAIQEKAKDKRLADRETAIEEYEWDNSITEEDAAAFTAGTKRKPISFLDLPSEVRNRVYEYALVSDSPIDLFPSVMSRDHQEHKLGAGLLAVCRALVDETATILYARNQFRFTNLKGWIALYLWLRMIGTCNRNWVSDISVHMPKHLGEHSTRHFFGGDEGQISFFQETNQQVMAIVKKWTVHRKYRRVTNRPMNRVAVKGQNIGYPFEEIFFHETKLLFNDMERLQKFSFIVPDDFLVTDERQWSNLNDMVRYCNPLRKEIALVFLEKTEKLATDPDIWQRNQYQLINTVSHYGWKSLQAEYADGETYRMVDLDDGATTLNEPDEDKWEWAFYGGWKSNVFDLW